MKKLITIDLLTGEINVYPFDSNVFDENNHDDMDELFDRHGLDLDDYTYNKTYIITDKLTINFK